MSLYPDTVPLKSGHIDLLLCEEIHCLIDLAGSTT